MNKDSKKAYLSLIQAGTNVKILQFAKRGLVDVNNILVNSLPNKCLLLSVYIGLMYEESLPMQKFFEYLRIKFHTTTDLQNYVFDKYRIENKKILSMSTFTEQLDYVGKQLNRRIAVFAAKDGLHSNFQSTFITNNEGLKRSIKIVLFNNHSYFLFTRKNIEKKSTEYCDVCCQSYSNILIHSCILEKCQSCFHYKSNHKTIMFDIGNLCQNDATYKEACLECGKSFSNKQCKFLHNKLPKSYCKRVKHCSKCQRLHQDKHHNCLTPFCRKCFSHHSKSKFCQIRQLKKLTKKYNCFLVHYENVAEEEEFMSITEIEQSQGGGTKKIHVFKKKENTYETFIFNCNDKVIEIVNHKKTFLFCLSDILKVLCLCQFVCVCNYSAIISSSSFQNVIRLEPNISEFHVYQKNNNIYKIQNKKFMFISSFELFYMEDIELCIYLKENPYPFFLNLALETIDQNQDSDSLTTEFFLSKIHHSDLSIINVFEDYKHYIKMFSTLSKSLLFKEKCIHVTGILLRSYNKIVNMYRTIFGNDNSSTELMGSESMISMFYRKLSQLLSEEKFPALPSFKPGNLKNTSRHELFVSEIIVESHLSRFPNHNMLSCVNGSGQQKRVKNLTADIYCEDCKIAIYVEGNFKYCCAIHDINVNINPRKKLLDKTGKYKRKSFCDALNVKDMFILPTCCIEKGLYTKKFRDSSFFNEKLILSPKKKIMVFESEYYQRLNCQDAILSPVSLPLVKGFKCIRGQIEKLDIEAAFLSVFSKEEFILPNKNESIQLIGKEAHEYFSKSNLNSTFMIARIFVLPHENLDFQIVPVKLKKGKSTYFYFCKTCALNGVFTKSILCNHTKYERGMYVTCYSIDLKMFQHLKYVFEVTEIIAFTASHSKQLNDFFSKCKVFKQNTNCNMEKILSKKAALSCLGRTALNTSKYQETKCKFSTNSTEIGFYMQSELVKSFHIFDKSILLNIKNTKKTTNFRRYLVACSRNTCSLLFGAANNEIRNTMIKVYLFTKSNISYESKILRISVDCLFVYLNNIDDKLKLKKYLRKTGFNFKLEESIKSIFNHKNAGYIVKKDNGVTCLKIPGFSLSIEERRNFKLRFTNILENSEIKGYKISPNYLMFY